MKIIFQSYKATIDIDWLKNYDKLHFHWLHFDGIWSFSNLVFF